MTLEVPALQLSACFDGELELEWRRPGYSFRKLSR
jgi:hypothetical protein